MAILYTANDRRVSPNRRQLLQKSESARLARLFVPAFVSDVGCAENMTADHDLQVSSTSLSLASQRKVIMPCVL